MRKLLASLLVAAGLLAGGAVASTAPAGATTKTQIFYAALDTKDVPHAGAVKYAKAYCASADKYGVKVAFPTYVAAAQQPGLDAGNIGYIIGAGTVAFCPRHTAELTALAGA